MIKLTITLLVFLSSCQLYAAEIFVATTGNDTIGNGSIGNPYATLHKANQVAVAHDTITLREGTYEGTVDAYSSECSTQGTQRARIRTPYLTIQGYPGEHAKIDNGYDPCKGYALWIDYPAHHVTLKNLDISGGTGYTIKFEIYFQATDGGSSYGTIDNCKIHDGGTDVIKIPAGVHNITIKNSEIYNSCTNLDHGGSIVNCQGIDAVQSHNGIISNNYIHDIRTGGNPGAYFKGGSRNTLFERNKIVGGDVGIALGGNTGTAYMDYVDNPDGYQTIDAIVRNNIIIGTTYAGIDVYCSIGAKIYNNTLLNVGSLEGGGAVGVSFKIDGDNANYMPPSDNILFANNIVYRNSGPGLRNLFYMRAYDGAPYQPAIADGGLKAHNNVYYDPSWGDFHGVDVSVGPRGNILYSTFAAWKLSALHADGYAEVSSLYTDPQVNLATGAVNAGSPVIGAGAGINGLTKDYYDNIRYGDITVGAIQYGGVIKLMPFLSNGHPTRAPQ